MNILFSLKRPIDRVLEAGATRVAVVSAMLQAPDIEETAAKFKKRLERL